MKTDGLETLLLVQGQARQYVVSPPPAVPGAGAFQGNEKLKRDVLKGIRRKFPTLENSTKLNVIHRIYMRLENGSRDILTGAVKWDEYSRDKLGLNEDLMIYLNRVYDTVGEDKAVQVMESVNLGAELPDIGLELTKLRVEKLQEWSSSEMKGRGKSRYVDLFTKADVALSLTDPDRRLALDEVRAELEDLGKTTTAEDRSRIAKAGREVIDVFQRRNGRFPERRKEILFSSTLSLVGNELFEQEGAKFEADWVCDLLRLS